MSDRKNITGGENRNTNPENVNEHFPEDSQAPKAVDSSQSAPDSHRDSSRQQQQATENMEVHKHPHHLTHKKKWGEYFLEFLMLFLAVFLGFLAENFREHQIEKERAKQYMVSMIEDLKADTSAISILNEQRSDRLGMYDSLSSAIIEKKYSETGSAFYYWGRNISRRAFFFSADGTMQQLKNSGGLRLISNQNISDKIIAYDALYRNIMLQQDLEEVQLNEYRDLAAKI